MEAALIAVVQRIEHYELALYGTARAHARQLGFIKIADDLGRIVNEEKLADRQLTALAENRVNVQAAMSKAYAN
jgi:ferritin-like metal-binding protein YciE